MTDYFLFITHLTNPFGFIRSIDQGISLSLRAAGGDVACGRHGNGPPLPKLQLFFIPVWKYSGMWKNLSVGCGVKYMRVGIRSTASYCQCIGSNLESRLTQENKIEPEIQPRLQLEVDQLKIQIKNTYS